MTMVQHDLALSPAGAISVDALRWIARRHRGIMVMPGIAAGLTGKWMHALGLPDSHEALGLQPGTAAIVDADDVLRAGRSTLRQLINRRALVRPDQVAWAAGIREICRSEYSPVATVLTGSVGRVEVADWVGDMRLTTDQSRRLIWLRSEHAREGIRIQADQVVSSIDCMIDAQHLFVAVMDCQAEAVTLGIDRRSILRISPSGHDAAARSVYLLATAPAAIAT